MRHLGCEDLLDALGDVVTSAAARACSSKTTLGTAEVILDCFASQLRDGESTPFSLVAELGVEFIGQLDRGSLHDMPAYLLLRVEGRGSGHRERVRASIWVASARFPPRREVGQDAPPLRDEQVVAAVGDHLQSSVREPFLPPGPMTIARLWIGGAIQLDRLGVHSLEVQTWRRLAERQRNDHKPRQVLMRCGERESVPSPR